MLSVLCFTSMPYLKVAEPNQWYLSILAYPSHTLLKDMVQYIIMAGVGYGIYIGIIKKDFVIMKKLRKFNLSFGDSNLMLMFFIFTMLLFGARFM